MTSPFDNVLSKEDFTQIVSRIVAAHDTSRAMTELIKDSKKATGEDMLVDFFDPFVLYSGQLDSLVKTLEVMFQDSNGWISWWLFECDYGHDEDLLATVSDADGESIPMSTVGDLYDLLVANLSLRRSGCDMGE